MKKTSIKIISALLLFIISHTLPGAEIIFKNGDQIRGDVLFQNKQVVKIKTYIGIQIINKRMIKRIIFSDFEKMFWKKWRKIINVFLKNGRFYRGIQISRSNTQLSIFTLTGVINLSLKDIRSINQKKEVFFEKQDNKYPLLPVVLRSAVLPSWGQHYMGKHNKAWLITALTGSFLLATIYFNSAYQDARGDYVHALNQKIFDQTLYDKANNYRTLNNIFLIATIGSWLYNIADAALNRNRKTVPGNFQASISCPIHEPGFVTSISVRF